MWNDTDIPLAYLITFRCYGTWLHGDKRGSIDRFHNRYKSAYLPQSDRRQVLNKRKLKSQPVILDIKRRRSVGDAITRGLHASQVAPTCAQSTNKSCTLRSLHRSSKPGAGTQCVQSIC